MLTEIEHEAELCRKAFEGIEVGTVVMHCHHSSFLEVLTEPTENRIQFILNNKAVTEQATRLRLFRPFKGELPENIVKASAEYDKALAEYDKASADVGKARVEYDKASAEYDKASADVGKARVEYHKASAEYDKASADVGKARVEYHKARAEYHKARAEYDKALAEYRKALSEYSSKHSEFCTCPWDNTHDIFGKEQVSEKG